MRIFCQKIKFERSFYVLAEAVDLVIPPPPVFVVGRWIDGARMDGCVNFHLDFSRCSYFSGKVPSVRRRRCHRRHRRRRATTTATATGAAVTSGIL